MQEWTEQELEAQLSKGERTLIFFHTPLCGTCQLAKKMLTVTEAMIPNLNMGISNLNYMPSKAALFEIESVPCLIEIKHNHVSKKIYAFHSVEHLLSELR
ncbi:thioredoxin family protein [Priestia megaterium]|nr:thioredoxin family protein [Priestia megaterium]